MPHLMCRTCPLLSSILTLVDICSSAQDILASKAKLVSAGSIQLNQAEVTGNVHSEQYPDSQYTSKDGQPELYDKPQGPVVDGDVESDKER